MKHHQLVVALSLICALLAGATESTAQEGFTEAFILHRGYEQLIAGENVDPSLGLQTTPGYGAAEVALNGQGTRVWFVLFKWGASPEYEVWTMNSDGTGAQQVGITTDHWSPSATALTTLFVDCSEDGAIAVLDSIDKFSLVDLGDPGAPSADLMFNLGASEPWGFSQGTLRVSNDGSTAVFVDTWAEHVYSVNLNALSPAPVMIAGAADLNLEGVNARTIFSLDISGDGSDWWTTAENWFSTWSGTTYNRNRYWLNHGSGLASPPTLIHETMPLGDVPAIGHIEVSDVLADGGLGYTLVSCPGIYAGLNNPTHCFVQTTGTSSFLDVGDDPYHLGAPVLADGGKVVYLLSDVFLGTPYGFLFWPDNQRRRIAGSQRLAGGPNPAFRHAELSDAGNVLAAPTPGGVYVLHEGMQAPPSFPKIEHIYWRYDSSSDELVVQVDVNAPGGFDRIFTLPMYNGIEPVRHLAAADNPFLGETGGGGVNYSTIFSPVGGSLWERRIDMDGKIDKLTSSFQLRLVIVDTSGSRTAFYDFQPTMTMIFSDGFESGDTLAWSGTVH